MSKGTDSSSCRIMLNNVSAILNQWTVAYMCASEHHSVDGMEPTEAVVLPKKFFTKLLMFISKSTQEFT